MLIPDLNAENILFRTVHFSSFSFFVPSVPSARVGSFTRLKSSQHFICRLVSYPHRYHNKMPANVSFDEMSHGKHWETNPSRHTSEIVGIPWRKMDKALPKPRYYTQDKDIHSTFDKMFEASYVP